MLGLIIFLVVIGVAVFLSVKVVKVQVRGEEDETSLKVRPAGLALGILIFLAGVVLVSAVGQVNAGYRGVVLQFGAVTQNTLAPGIYMVTPFVNSVEMMDVQTHAYEAKASAASKDLQDVQTTVTLNYALDSGRVNVIYETLRRDFVERIVKPAVQESVKAVTARFEAEKLIAERPMVKSEIETALRDRLAVHGILVETISITDFQFSQEFSKAIEAKVVAAQDALQAENKLARVKVEAQQAEAEAKGKANAAIANAEGQKQSEIKRAEGDAQATLLRAEAQARANEMVNKTLTDQVIRYSLVQKLGDDIKVVVLPSGQQFIIGPELLGK